MCSILPPKPLNPSKQPSPISTSNYPEFVAFHFLDPKGELRVMEEDGSNVEKFLSEGLSVDGSSIPGMLTVEKSDLRVIPEKDTYLKLDVDGFTHHRFLAHLEDEHGNPHPRDPRGILKKAADKAASLGFAAEMFSEVEFYIVNQEDGTPADNAGYCSLPPLDKCYEFRHKIGKICKDVGMKVKRIHHENGPGQNEIELDLTPCMKNADDTVLCMWILELLAAKRNQKIIFSPKPFDNEAGNGLHQHILLRDLLTGENMFMNPQLRGVTAIPSDDMERLSEPCKHGIAGLIKYANEITAVFASSKESFVRLQPGFEAPGHTAWDFSNRTALIRVPQTSNNMVRFEYRGGDLSGSVHLFAAVLLSAVVKGIEDKLELPPNANFNVDELSEEELERRGIRSVPRSIEDCLHILRTSEFLQDALGPEMVQLLIERDEKLQAEC